MKKLLCVLAALLILGCSGGKKTAHGADAPQQLSERLSRIQLTGLDGRSFSLRDFAGRPVFLNFWATWCRPCISEMASIEQVRQLYGDQIVFLLVSHEDPEKIRAFRQEYSYGLEMARLDNELIDVFVVTLPTTLLIDRTGRLLYEEEGARVWTQFNNMEKVKALLPGEH